MEKVGLQNRHTTDEVASDVHATKLRKLLYPKKKLSTKNREILLHLLAQIGAGHPLSRVIEFPQFHEARKQLVRLAQKHKHIT